MQQSLRESFWQFAHDLFIANGESEERVEFGAPVERAEREQDTSHSYSGRRDAANDDANVSEFNSRSF